MKKLFFLPAFALVAFLVSYCTKTELDPSQNIAGQAQSVTDRGPCVATIVATGTIFICGDPALPTPCIICGDPTAPSRGETFLKGQVYCYNPGNDAISIQNTSGAAVTVSITPAQPGSPTTNINIPAGASRKVWVDPNTLQVYNTPC
jgi:hypothetical protein